MKHFILTALTLLIPFGAFAEEPPKMPEPLENLAAEGAQLRYLGKDKGLDGWVAIKAGQEQYFYVTPDGKGFVMGILFDENGDLVTVRQVQKLQENGDKTLDILTKDGPLLSAKQSAQERNADFQNLSPSEQLFADIESANWITLGNSDAPVIYSFIDPQCPHCHEFVREVRADGYLESGKAQIRAIPVGFREETARQAAFLIAAPDAQARFFKQLDEQEELPIDSDISLDGVSRNIAIMQSWKLDVTPISVYRATDGTVKIIRGKPQNIKSVVNDLKG